MKIPSDAKNIRITLEDDLNKRWKRAIAARKVQQTDAIIALIDLFTKQDDATQLAMLGSLTPDEDVLQMIFKRKAGVTGIVTGGATAEVKRKAKQAS